MPQRARRSVRSEGARACGLRPATHEILLEHVNVRPLGTPSTTARHQGRLPVAGSIMDAMNPHLTIDRSAVRAFCQRHHIARLALFGSALRDDFGADSDVDILVEFEPGHVPGLSFVSMERELSQLLQGRRVDLVTPGFLNGRIREQILREAEPLYVAA